MASTKIPSVSMTTSPAPSNASPSISLSDFPNEKEYPWVTFVSNLGWYNKSTQPAIEKNLVLKLDLCILIFGSLSFFTKYLDQQSITNAYVTGMKDDLGLTGNDLNYITVIFWASYCGFMIPACYYMTRYPANIILPTLELGWGLATLGMAFAHNIHTVYAMRFFVGLFECCTFTGTIYVIGSWYKPEEMARRVVIFFIAAPAGTMFAGYLQAAVYTHMNGTHGLEGWRWQFIIDSMITFAVSIIGYTMFPDIPSRSKPLLFTDRDMVLSNLRLKEQTTAPPQLKLSSSIFCRVFTRWHFYAFVLAWTIFDQNTIADATPFSLYLSYNSPELYTTVQVNTLPTIAKALMIAAALVTGVAIDRYRNFWIPALTITLLVLIASLLLVIWDVGEAGRLAAFFMLGLGGPMSPILMSWATLVMSGDAEERAVVTASMNAIGQGVMAGTQVIQYPASGAPRWKGGFISSLVTAVAQIFAILGILYLSRREEAWKKKAAGSVHPEGEDTDRFQA